MQLQAIRSLFLALGLCLSSPSFAGELVELLGPGAQVAVRPVCGFRNEQSYYSLLPWKGFEQKEVCAIASFATSSAPGCAVSRLQACEISLFISQCVGNRKSSDPVCWRKDGAISSQPTSNQTQISNELMQYLWDVDFLNENFVVHENDFIRSVFAKYFGNNSRGVIWDYDVDEAMVELIYAVVTSGRTAPIASEALLNIIDTL